MTARLLEGKVFAAKLKEEAGKKAQELKAKYGITPGLAVIIVGENPASQVYVRNKHKACTELGFYSEGVELPAQRVSRWKIDSIYCSPLGRAQATAAYSLEKLGRTAVTKEFLREFKGHVYNPYNGLDHISWDLMPDYWTQSETMYDKDNWTSDPIIKGSRDDIAAEWKMVQDGIDEIIAANGYTRKGRYYTFTEHSDNTVVIFCHFGVTMVMMSHILGIAPPVMLHGLFLPNDVPYFR